MSFAKDYAKKLLDGRWQKKRLEILQRDGFCCTICQRQHNVQIHHNWYLKNMEPWDYNGDQLVTLCNEHHEEIGELQEGLKRLLARSGPEVQRKVYDYLYGLLNEKKQAATNQLPRYAVDTSCAVRKPKLGAYRQQEEKSRIERLERVSKRLEHFDFYGTIRELYDHKGCLQCVWEREHSNLCAFLYVYEAWEAEGECWQNVEHCTVDGLPIEKLGLPLIVWRLSAAYIDGMLADFAGQAIQAKVSESKWTVRFPSGGNKTIEFCSSAERKEKLTDALRCMGYEAKEIEFCI